MISKLKALTAGLTLSTLSAISAQADGVYQMFTDNGYYIDDIEITGDVTLPNGVEMAALVMRQEHLKLYVDPDGIYVTLDPNNPILTQNPPFYGYWISTQSPDVGHWPACQQPVVDEYGNYHWVYGEVVWTNTGLTANYDHGFNVFLSACDNSKELWLFNAAYMEMNMGGGVPHGDIPPQDAWTVVDSYGDEFYLEAVDNYSILTSATPREISIPMATYPVTYETFFEHESIIMNQDCSTFSQLHGYGRWSWANGGFVVNFDNVSFSFPRMDGPADNSGACRM